MEYSNPYQSPSLNDLLSLKGKNALVIGGSGLLGGEMSYTLAELGANVIVASRDIDKCMEFIKQMSKKFPGNHGAHSVDITSDESINELIKNTKEDFNGELDILINSGWSGNKNTFESISNQDWDHDIEVCLNGVFRTIKAAHPLLKESQGVILNIASMYGHVAPDYRIYEGNLFSNPPSYGAAKAGVIQLTKYCASFLSVDKIRVNVLSPGPFPLEGTQKESPEFIERLASKNPVNRIGNPHDLKGATAILCSDAGAYMTGQNICVDGGWSVW